MLDNKAILYNTLYVVLAMIVVSLSDTYGITKNILSKLGYSYTDEEYGTGSKLKQKGFLLHIIVFAVLVAVPMMLKKSA